MYISLPILFLLIVLIGSMCSCSQADKDDLNDFIGSLFTLFVIGLVLTALFFVIGYVATNLMLVLDFIANAFVLFIMFAIAASAICTFINHFIIEKFKDKVLKR